MQINVAKKAFLHKKRQKILNYFTKLSHVIFDIYSNQKKRNLRPLRVTCVLDRNCPLAACKQASRRLMSNSESALSQRLTAGCLQKNGIASLTKKRHSRSVSSPRRPSLFEAKSQLASPCSQKQNYHRTDVMNATPRRLFLRVK